MAQLGIKETKELLKFISDLGEAISVSSSDGWSATDIMNFIPAAKSAFSGIAGIDQVIEELKDLDELEKQEIEDYIAEEFDIADDKIEEYIEHGLRVALDLWTLVKTYF